MQEQKALHSRLRRVRSELEERQRPCATTTSPSSKAEEEQKFEDESDITNFVEAQIEEAMRSGSFDNLRNKGRPLPRGQPQTTVDIAMRIMRENGVRPHWLQLMHDIDHDTRLLRKMLAHAWKMHMPQAPHHWNGACRVTELRIREINARVDTFNLTRPFSFKHLFRLRLRLEDEICRAHRAAADTLVEAGGAAGVVIQPSGEPKSHARSDASDAQETDSMTPPRQTETVNEPRPSWQLFARFVRAAEVREYERPTWGRRRSSSPSVDNSRSAGSD